MIKIGFRWLGAYANHTDSRDAKDTKILKSLNLKIITFRGFEIIYTIKKKHEL